MTFWAIILLLFVPFIPLMAEFGAVASSASRNEIPNIIASAFRYRDNMVDCLVLPSTIDTGRSAQRNSLNNLLKCWENKRIGPLPSPPSSEIKPEQLPVISISDLHCISGICEQFLSPWTAIIIVLISQRFYAIFESIFTSPLAVAPFAISPYYWAFSIIPVLVFVVFAERQVSLAASAYFGFHASYYSDLPLQIPPAI